MFKGGAGVVKEEPETKRLDIGSVTFRLKGAHWMSASPMGALRMALLRAFFRREEQLGWEAVALNPERPVMWDEVNWDTAGEEVIDD